MIQTLTRLFPLWAILFSGFAFAFPDQLATLSWAIVPLLMLIMFGMGMTLTWADFADAGKRPVVIGAGVALQFLIMPLVGLLVGSLLRLPPEWVLGLVLVGACPGGTASNVICYLARADVALSIAMTSVSTLLAVLATPLLVWVYQGQAIDVPVASMLGSLVKIILLPVVAGTFLNSVFGARLTPVRNVFPLVSVIAIVVVIGVIVALNRERIATGGLLVMLAVVLHNLLGLSLGYGGARLLRLDPARARTLAIEVGMQNSGLGVALAVKHFSASAALPAALFSVWHNLSGSLLAWYWRRRQA
ncbi:bile acid:sodium symporter family protein [Alloalcanivorax profundimaris]|uniref:bile acid:sodium symporter family protein n=1 Tax=Alloalcanivorax profundimaris TaxID=2735259 RepID=UPI000C391018|nr:bile acid:sodium symporter family protein [Alloalcanivorax profundimaris]MAY09426.1 bile acid:sodium symporter [Alcanivorax sp.]MBM1143164.1 bile acid:sodium symporter family protein [Alcanivorax sp. ZXX171]MBF1802849.1 bile acid:sodium symporter family protein [Alloalcanivorax profundimaris]MBI53349.1 bile acid:sodium symporter [Alcanivorax sp.]HCE40837.1 bile acid:sodium symporter [Alcanivorax sp.]|tara:strand:+ start:32325 stop:33233 length:909 start_codon:yes stop_codon:yes gene_type:complete